MDKEKIEIVVIEDDDNDFEYLSEKLNNSQAFECHIHRAVDLDDLASFSLSKIDLIFCDINLQKTKGLETLNAISSLEVETPVVILSGIEEDSLYKETARSSVIDFINKNELSELNLERKILFLLNKFSYQKNKALTKELELVKMITAETAHQLNNSLCILSMLTSKSIKIEEKYKDKIQNVSGNVKRHTQNMLFLAHEFDFVKKEVSLEDFVKALYLSVDFKMEGKVILCDLDMVTFSFLALLEDLSSFNIESSSVENELLIKLRFDGISNIHTYGDLTFSMKVLEGVIRQHRGRVVFKKGEIEIIFPISSKSSELVEKKSSIVKTILLVEDELEIRELMAACLEDHGYEVDLACNGVEAIESLKKKEYDLIVSDFLMPELSGDSVYKEFRERTDKPFLFASGYSSGVIANILNKDQNCYFIQKPFSPKQLIDAVKNV